MWLCNDLLVGIVGLPCTSDLEYGPSREPTTAYGFGEKRGRALSRLAIPATWFNFSRFTSMKVRYLWAVAMWSSIPAVNFTRSHVFG